MGEASIDSEEFGQRLRSLRKAAGLTQKELGGARFSHAYISTLESSRRSPSASALIFLSERLGTDLSAILLPEGSELAEALEHLPEEGPEAVRLLEEILRSVERVHDPLLKGDVLRLVGESRLDDAPAIAEMLLLKALDVYRSALPEGRSGFGRTLFLLGEAALSRGAPTALEFYRQAAALFVAEGAGIADKGSSK